MSSVGRMPYLFMCEYPCTRIGSRNAIFLKKIVDEISVVGSTRLRFDKEQSAIDRFVVRMLPVELILALAAERCLIDLGGCDFGRLEILGLRLPLVMADDRLRWRMHFTGRNIEHRDRESTEPVNSVRHHPNVDVAIVCDITSALWHVFFAAKAVPIAWEHAIMCFGSTHEEGLQPLFAMIALGGFLPDQQLKCTPHAAQIVGIGDRLRRPVLRDAPLQVRAEQNRENRQRTVALQGVRERGAIRRADAAAALVLYVDRSGLNHGERWQRRRIAGESGDVRKYLLIVHVGHAKIRGDRISLQLKVRRAAGLRQHQQANQRAPIAQTESRSNWRSFNTHGLMDVRNAGVEMDNLRQRRRKYRLSKLEK